VEKCWPSVWFLGDAVERDQRGSGRRKPVWARAFGLALRCAAQRLTDQHAKVDVCDKHYVFDAQQPPKGSKSLAFDPTGKCPAFVVNPQIARAALGKQHADQVQDTQLVTANAPVAPIHSGLDGGTNRVFLAQVGGSVPPARVPQSKSQPTPPPDNNDSLASRLFGLFGWKSAAGTQVASADPTTLERGAHSAATGSILAPKIKLAPEGYTVASATPNEPYTNEAAKNDVPELQQTAAALPMPAQQEAASATVSMVAWAEYTPSGSFVAEQTRRSDCGSH
jgi:hypothetical protein